VRHMVVASSRLRASTMERHLDAGRGRRTVEAVSPHPRFRPNSRTYDSRPRSGRCQRDDSSYDIRQHPPRHQEGLANRTRSQGWRTRWIQVSSGHSESRERRLTWMVDVTAIMTSCVPPKVVGEVTSSVTATGGT